MGVGWGGGVVVALKPILGFRKRKKGIISPETGTARSKKKNGKKAKGRKASLRRSLVTYRRKGERTNSCREFPCSRNTGGELEGRSGILCQTSVKQSIWEAAGMRKTCTVILKAEMGKRWGATVILKSRVGRER